jgi:transcriptional regulator with XRE-family HTH domain
MPGIERLYDRGTRRADRQLVAIGEEFRHARTRLALSQREVAEAVHIDRADYSRIESGKLKYLSMPVACRVGAVLGLDVSLKAFPGGSSIRDSGQAERLRTLLVDVGRPLRYRLEVTLPANPDRPDQRAWDVMLFGLDERTAIEFEARLYDIQAQLRRIALKRRDDPVNRFLLVIANTRTNRRVIAEHADLLAGLPHLRTDTVLKLLRLGRHPPTGFMLLDAPVRRQRRAHPGEPGEEGTLAASRASRTRGREVACG